MNTIDIIASEITKDLAIRGISKAEAGAKIGVSPQGFSAILHRPISRRTAAVLHQVFGYDENFLLTGKGDLFGEDSRDVLVGNEDGRQGVFIPSETMRMYDNLTESLRLLSELLHDQKKLEELPFYRNNPAAHR